METTAMSTDDGLGAFPLVCVGGSAGVLDAYAGLLREFPVDLGVAVVIINYLKNVAEQLLDTLPEYTKLPIEIITEGLVIRPNHVYIIVEEREVHVLEGRFHLEAITKPTGWPDVVTVFLGSVTTNWKGQIIAVILSGYGGDGAAALSGVKEAGGITFAQKADTAGQPDMPLSAIASGCIDFILSVEEIPKEIERSVRHAQAAASKGAESMF
jgi:two-component system chemotaxis response regulator CheB